METGLMNDTVALHRLAVGMQKKGYKEGRFAAADEIEAACAVLGLSPQTTRLLSQVALGRRDNGNS